MWFVLILGSFGAVLFIPGLCLSPTTRYLACHDRGQAPLRPPSSSGRAPAPGDLMAKDRPRAPRVAACSFSSGLAMPIVLSKWDATRYFGGRTEGLPRSVLYVGLHEVGDCASRGSAALI